MRMTVQLDPDVVERIRVRMHDAELTFDEALNEVVRAGLRELNDDARPVDGPSTRTVPSIGDTVTGRTADPDLRGSLVQDLVAEIHEEPFQPQHRQQPFRSVVRGWPSRLEAYFWPDPGTNYEVTHQRMTPWFEEAGELSERLLAEGSWTAVDRDSATRLAWTMLEWGRVTRQSDFSERTVERVFPVVCKAVDDPWRRERAVHGRVRTAAPCSTVVTG